MQCKECSAEVLDVVLARHHGSTGEGETVICEQHVPPLPTNRSTHEQRVLWNHSVTELSEKFGAKTLLVQKRKETPTKKLRRD